jgi:hypothetical protein
MWQTKHLLLDRTMRNLQPDHARGGPSQIKSPWDPTVPHLALTVPTISDSF